MATIQIKSPLQTRIFAVMGIVFGLLLIAAFVFPPNYFLAYKKHSSVELEAARRYVEGIPASSAPTLFATNVRSFRSYGDRELAERGINEFKDAQAFSYGWQVNSGWEIDVVVAPGFLTADATVRRQILMRTGVTRSLTSSLLNISSTSESCIARKISPFGWTDYGFVLVDPLLGSMSEEELVRCLVAGLSFINGLPVEGEKFQFSKMPPRLVSAVVLDFVMRCAYEDISDTNPHHRSRAGITTQPSIPCVANKISAAGQAKLRRP